VPSIGIKEKAERKTMKQKDHETGASTACDTCGDKGCSVPQRKKNESQEEFEDRKKLQSRLCRIRHKVVVLSGKGGVGKSTVAVNLATALMLSGKRVGLLDVDIHGPSIPTMLGLDHVNLQGCEEGLFPVETSGMKVMSLGFLLKDPDDAVIWRGPLKMGVIKQFLKDVVWGDLDFLVIDSPPGTGDEPLSVCQLIGDIDGAVIVTTPQKVAAVDVRKSITFCRQLHVSVIGVVENMSGFVCPHCGEITPILRTGGGKQIADDMGVPFLGSIPMDPVIAETCDTGRVFINAYAAAPTARIMTGITGAVAALDAQRAARETA
jgi:Mrp family chromosome partitioning ATPase